MFEKNAGSFLLTSSRRQRLRERAHPDAGGETGLSGESAQGTQHRRSGFVNRKGYRLNPGGSNSRFPRGPTDFDKKTSCMLPTYIYIYIYMHTICVYIYMYIYCYSIIPAVFQTNLRKPNCGNFTGPLAPTSWLNHTEPAYEGAKPY